VKSSREFDIEPSCTIKCLGNYRVYKLLGISRVVLSSMKLGSKLCTDDKNLSIKHNISML
jgi:hypothetical protein